MSRKVYLEGEATVLVSVKLKFWSIVRINDNASIDRAFTQFAKGKKVTTADLETLDVQEITEVGGYADEGDHLEFESAVQDALESGQPFTVHNVKVVDSK